MHEKSIQTLEYPKILAKVAHEAAFSASKELVMGLEPTADLQEARRRQAYTTEASRLIDLNADVSVRGAHDIRAHLVRAAREGILLPADLVEILFTVRSAHFVSRTLEKLDPESFPLLRALGADIPVRPQIARRIEETVSEDGEVLDTASPGLRKIRFELRGANQRLQDRLRTLVNEFGPSLQEALVTTRNDRYVIPVKAEQRSHVRGIVHDQSSSGATVFVEPMVIVEMNNRLRELQAEERQEIERILRQLSSEIGREAETLKVALELLAEFDLHLAKARYGRMTRSSEPRLNTDGIIQLRNARHPLLTGKVVPTNFHLGRDFFMVVITGPNTGGKTVALKTVGLLSLMAQAGLHIPADDDSEITIFQDIFADIGDEQSIEQNLSTFSSHLSRIIEILRTVEEYRKRSTPDIRGKMADELVKREARPQPTLVLFDELGAGTDPSEGSALARAILTFLLDRHITTVATTHYSELKAFAHEQKGVVNASVEFDIETLSPTYKLSIGLPGRSNALAIAQRLGLDNRIIRGARRFLGNAGVRMENLLEGLQSERKAAEDERFNLNMERVEAEYQRKQLESERHQLELDRIRILNEARAQASRELDEVLREIGKVRATAKRGNITQDHLGEARQRARALEQKVTSIPEPMQRQNVARDERLDGPLQIGDTVRVLSFGQNAELLGLSADRSEAEVQMGALRFRVNVDTLERISKRKAASEERARPNIIMQNIEERPPVDLQLDMRGWRVEDALAELDTYLNDAVLAGLSSVRLLHGKGTGALRQAVREQLTHHPLVKSFAFAPPKEGGDGVTIVKFSA
ncbi:endonuclease MutS2 [Tengunoibacter tsumagoiensis]|uniref:Endonuclease MutS2 n=1 Tax=Tengunoibacter tsumagoiensis TaxID=2014871 RepID=A0A402A446_9CHLR|nr:endonuclease MutS2 [Tengunoibacter tsumagoiensis]GCE13908.1 endonuclease MutS2 [Tengunoibacter tsumagoiensis]